MELNKMSVGREFISLYVMEIKAASDFISGRNLDPSLGILGAIRVINQSQPVLSVLPPGPFALDVDSV
jgi:hypothetical protein